MSEEECIFQKTLFFSNHDDGVSIITEDFFFENREGPIDLGRVRKLKHLLY